MGKPIKLVTDRCHAHKDVMRELKVIQNLAKKNATTAFGIAMVNRDGTTTTMFLCPDGSGTWFPLHSAVTTLQYRVTKVLNE